jgi:hypothetical protein
MEDCWRLNEDDNTLIGLGLRVELDEDDNTLIILALNFI